jgi:hypothetical protein
MTLCNLVGGIKHQRSKIHFNIPLFTAADAVEYYLIREQKPEYYKLQTQLEQQTSHKFLNHPHASLAVTYSEATSLI